MCEKEGGEDICSRGLFIIGCGIREVVGTEFVGRILRLLYSSLLYHTDVGGPFMDDGQVHASM